MNYQTEKIMGRRSIKEMPKLKEGNNPNEHREEKVYRWCEKCRKGYFLNNGEEQEVLNDEDYEKRTKGKLYPEIPYTCKQCKESHEESPLNIININIENNSSFSPILIFCGIVVLAAAIFVIYSNQTVYSAVERLKETPFAVSVPKQSQREKLLDEDLYKLEDTYTRQEERVWYTLLAGIKSVVRANPNQPSVFLMLYDSDSAGNTARCLAKDAVKAASKFLMGKQKEALVYSGRSLERKDLLDDPGKLLIHLNDTVREKGSLVITNLQDVPPKVAKSFHFICDKYSPLVERAVLFFTLSVVAVGPKLHKDAEARLSELWAKDMDESFLNPLITRMTPNILKITSDNYSC